MTKIYRTNPQTEEEIRKKKHEKQLWKFLMKNFFSGEIESI